MPRTRWVLLTAVLTVIALEGVIWMMHQPSPIARRMVAAASSPGARATRDVFMFGSCHVDDLLSASVIQAQLGQGFKLHNITADGTSPMDWNLVLANLLRLNSSPGAGEAGVVVVPYGPRDLIVSVYPWESQVMDLARWSDMPQLLDLTCTSLGCQTDMLLRKAWLTYRYRGLISKWFWTAMASEDPAQTPLMPGGLPHPERFGGPQPCKELDRGVAKIVPVDPSPGSGKPRRGVALGSWGGPQADNQTERISDRHERLTAANWGMPVGVLESIIRQPYGFLKAFIDTARSRGMRVIFLHLPHTRPPPPEQVNRMQAKEALHLFVPRQSLPPRDPLTETTQARERSITRWSTQVGQLIADRLVQGRRP